jgi:hypothetical protein
MIKLHFGFDSESCPQSKTAPDFRRLRIPGMPGGTGNRRWHHTFFIGRVMLAQAAEMHFQICGCL